MAAITYCLWILWKVCVTLHFLATNRKLTFSWKITPQGGVPPLKRRNPWSILAIKKFFILGCSLCYILLLVTRSLVAVHRCPIFCRPSLVTNASECTLKRRRWWLKLRRPLTPTVSEKTWRNKWSVYIFYCMDWLGGNWNFDGLVQDCSNSSMLTMELLQSCIKPSICAHGHYYHYCLGGNWNFDSLVQDCSNSIMLTMELLQSCTKPSLCTRRCCWALLQLLFAGNWNIDGFV